MPTHAETGTILMSTHTIAEPQPKKTKQRPLAGEVALITGASSGIGAATAQELARRGARVVLAARRQDELEAEARAIARLGGEALVVPTDMSDAAQVARLAERAIEHYGRVDILVNNAGMGYDLPLARMQPEQITHITSVNLLSAIQLTRAVLPGMLERRHGAIICVASVAAHIAVSPMYSATKFGLRGFARSLRREVWGTGVSVSVVSPGFIKTAMTRFRKRAPGPELIARTIACLVTHPAGEAMRPRYYRPTTWVEQGFPWLVDRLIGPWMAK